MDNMRTEHEYDQRFVLAGTVAVILVAIFVTLRLPYGLILGHSRGPLDYFLMIAIWLVVARMANFCAKGYDETSLVHQHANKLRYCSLIFAATCIVIALAVGALTVL